MEQSLPEFWLRGPVEGIPPLLQPAAHALLQAMDEVKALMKNFPDHLLWEKPAGLASPGFHLLHMKGVLNRLCTYAKEQPLSEEQMTYLKAETEASMVATKELVDALEAEVNRTLQQFRNTPESSLTEQRLVGRKGLPSTVQGLLFHAAEHTMRHLGQLLVTVRVVGRADG